MRVYSIVFGVFGVCDLWRGAQDRSWKYGGHIEMATYYKFH
jgi:hypothetical protein